MKNVTVFSTYNGWVAKDDSTSEVHWKGMGFSEYECIECSESLGWNISNR